MKQVTEEQAWRALASSVVAGAVEKGIQGDPYEIAWIGSDHAQTFYDVLGIDRNKAVAEFLRMYFDALGKANAWGTIRNNASKQVTRERRNG